jgi:hypothetical protein
VTSVIHKEKFASSLAVVDSNSLNLAINKHRDDLMDLREKQVIIDAEIESWVGEFTSLNNRPPVEDDRVEISMLYVAQNKCSQAITKKKNKLIQAEDALQTHLGNFLIIYQINLCNFSIK